MIIKRNKTAKPLVCYTYPDRVQEHGECQEKILPPPITQVAEVWNREQHDLKQVNNVLFSCPEEYGPLISSRGGYLQMQPVRTSQSVEDYINSVKMSYCLCNPQPAKPQKKASQSKKKDKKTLSKSEMNIAILENYDWEPVEKRNTVTGELYTAFKCTYINCNREMETSWNMLDHARMHVGVKPYKCLYCKKRFTQKGNMRKHAKLHLTPHVEARRKYKCKFCNNGFTEKYNLMVRLFTIFSINSLSNELIPNSMLAKF